MAYNRGFYKQTLLRMRMSTFDQREESFEKRFAHDEERQFRAEARRNKLLGLWAAEKLGKSKRRRGLMLTGLWRLR